MAGIKCRVMAFVDYQNVYADLLPALEAVDQLRGSKRFQRLCAVSYSGLSKQLQLPDPAVRQPYVFRLRRADYELVHDPRVYVEPEPRIEDGIR